MPDFFAYVQYLFITLLEWAKLFMYNISSNNISPEDYIKFPFQYAFCIATPFQWLSHSVYIVCTNMYAQFSS